MCCSFEYTCWLLVVCELSFIHLYICVCECDCSASLDQHVKVYDLSTYEVTHTMKYNKAILSVAMNEAATMFAVGMVDGNVVIRKSKQQSKADEGPSFDEVAAMMTKRKPRTGTKRYFNRGVGYKGEQDDFKVDAQRKQRLMKYDKLLKNFEYHKALDQALSQQHAVTTASVLEELNCRDGLRIALSNRSPKSLEPLLRFINKCITNPHYSTFVIQLTEMVLDMYKDTIGASVVTDELFIDLQRRVNAEMTLEKQMQQMRGGLDMLLAASRPQGQQNDNKRRRLTEN
jgi:U3 small nucleolar RNA-associated protein 15